MFTMWKKIQKKFISCNEFARISGVRFGQNAKFRSKNFGSEPYLIKVGNDFETSGNVTFLTHDGSVGVLRNLYAEYQDIDIFQKIEIGNNVFLGFNVTVLPGTNIGDNVIVGTGSIIRGILNSNSVYAGVPVRYICSVEEYKLKNKKKFVKTFFMDAKTKKAFLKKTILGS